MASVCFGEFDWPDQHSRRAYMRIAFLFAVNAEARGVCRDLYGEAFPLYGDLVKECGRVLTASEMLDLAEDFEGCASPALLVLDSRPVTESVKRLLRKWNLNCEWMQEIALDTLRHWRLRYKHKPKPTRIGFYLSIPRGGFTLSNIPAPPAGFSEYDPLYEPRAAYLKGIASRAQTIINESPILSEVEPSHKQTFANAVAECAAISNYCAEVERCFENAGYPRGKTDGKRNLSRHLIWTVESQVLERPFEKIAAQHSVTPMAVSRAVRSVLAEIRLSQRPGVKRGRPKGSRTLRFAHNPAR